MKTFPENRITYTLHINLAELRINSEVKNHSTNGLNTYQESHYSSYYMKFYPSVLFREFNTHRTHQIKAACL